MQHSKNSEWGFAQTHRVLRVTTNGRNEARPWCVFHTKRNSVPLFSELTRAEAILAAKLLNAIGFEWEKG